MQTRERERERERESNSQIVSGENQATSSQSQAQSGEIKSYELEETTVVGSLDDTKKYNSGNKVGRDTLNSAPNGNGDIGSALKVLPNVQFDNTQLKSTTPGEIDAANISISGGLFYQNNIQIDGFNANNDLTSNIPNDITSGTSKGARSQSFNIDTSLLESIVVQDSNIGAAYGGFTGGVVEANIRRPKKDGKWHTDFSYQMTQGNAKPGKFSLTKYHIDKYVEDTFLNSADENYQPKFIKHIIRASIDGYFTENFGILGSFSSTQSIIPLVAANRNVVTTKKRTQKRESYNYYLKGFWQPSDNFLLEMSLGYMPQDNTYFDPQGIDSFYTYTSGGWQGGLKAISTHTIGTWTNLLGYSYIQSSRESQLPVYYRWYLSETNDYGLGYYDTRYGARFIKQGNSNSQGHLDQMSHSLPFKSDFAFEPVKAWVSTHTFHIGFELNYQWAKKARPSDFAWYSYYNSQFTKNTEKENGTSISASFPMPLLPNQSCPTGPDRFGGYPCAYGTPYDKPNTWTQADYAVAIGQWFSEIGSFFGKASVKMHNFSYATFVEDDINFDLGNFGDINTRLGLRLDGDTYMSKKTLAPRFALNYITPAPQSWQTKLTFGANRYYARNLFSYRLLDFPPSDSIKQFKRDCPTCEWYEVRVTSWNSRSGIYLDKKLNIPYDDELMAGLSQNFGIFNANVKYIFRDGKDELKRVRNTWIDLDKRYDPSISTSVGNYSVWRNEGSSKRHIVSFTFENYEPIKTFGIQHHYLFAFDYTSVKRSYETTDYDELDFNDADIIYDGKLIKYRDRPVDNFVRPYTLRLSTTHTAKFWRTKWLFNNFFRYRSPYERMITVRNTNPIYTEWKTLYPNAEGVYEKKHFAGAFTWDMRVGFEVDVYRENTFYMNVDVLNVLNKANKTALTNASGNTGEEVLTYSYTYSAYDIGRQFWLQVGYKY